MANSIKEAAKSSLTASSESNSQNAYTFRFVEVGEPSKSRDEDARSLIRSHVMRDFYERRDNRRRPSTLPEKTSAASKKEGAAQQTHRFKVGPQGLTEIKKRRRKSEAIVQGRQPVLPSATNLHRPRCPVHPDSGNPVSEASRLESIPCIPSMQNENQTTSTSIEGGKATDPAIPSYISDHHADVDSNKYLRPEPLPPGSGIDPFNTLPPSKSPRTQVLLYHATRLVLSSRLMGQLRTEWLSIATQDAALFHVALSHYAGNYGLIRQRSDPVEALRFRMEAMRLINQRLGHVENALLDGTVGTVAALSSYEATNGSLMAIKTHMKGLRRLVTLRGGLQAVGNVFTQRLILWADVNCANALGTRPVYDFIQNTGKPALTTTYSEVSESEEYSDNSAPLFIRTPGKNDLGALSLELESNFASLRHLANVVSDAAGVAGDKENQIRDSDKLYVTERSLLILANTWGPSKFATSGCIAATIYLDNHLRGVGFNAKLMDRLVTRLQFSMNMVLNDVSKHCTNDKTAQALFWVLCVGGIAAEGRLEREWFITQLPDFSEILGLETWEEAQLILVNFLWAPSWYNQGRLLWIRSEELRLLKNMARDTLVIVIGDPASKYKNYITYGSIGIIT